jgi:hypothetical protein
LGPLPIQKKIAMFIKNLKFSKNSDILIHKIKIKNKRRESLSEQRREDERNKKKKKKKKTPARFSNGRSEEKGTVSIQT